MKKFPIYYLLLFSFQVYSQQFDLKNGDLIFQSIACGPLCDAINQVTEGYNGMDFNHMGMVIIKEDGVYVLEAAGTEVTLTTYNNFVKKTYKPMYVGRLKNRFQKLIPKAINYGLKQLGKPYDDAYLYGNNKYYCSELIYDCFLHAKGKPLFQLLPMTYKLPGTNTYFEVWKAYFEKLNMNIPEGELGCNPGGLSRSKKIKILATFGG